MHVLRLYIALSATLTLATIASEQDMLSKADIIRCTSTISSKGSTITYTSAQRGIQVSSVPGTYFYAGTQRVTREQGTVQVMPLENPCETFLELQKLWTAQHNIKVIAVIESPVVKKSSKRTCSIL